MQYKGVKMRSCEEETEEKKTSFNNPLQIIESPNGKIVDFYLLNSIEDIEDYVDFLREVGNTKAEDTIKVHINNYGGNVDVAMNIYDALRQSPADVVISVEGMCASAASMIMLAGTEWCVYPHSTVMIHAWSGFSYGKWNEIQASHDFEKRVLEKRFRDLYKKFMTDEEIELCLQGKDYYFDNEETIKRLESYQEDTLKKQQAIQEVTSKYQKLINDEIEAIINEPIDSEKPKSVKKGKKSAEED